MASVTRQRPGAASLLVSLGIGAAQLVQGAHDCLQTVCRIEVAPETVRTEHSVETTMRQTWMLRKP